MSQNNLVIYDDSIIKLSINQGTEDQRVSTTLGSFTMGELVTVRDNARVFMGDCENNMANEETHETIGGVLVGNKYLGLVDSKPIIGFRNSSIHLNYETETIPEKWESSNSFMEEWKEPSILGEDSKLKLVFPENKKDWPRENAYNKTYNAYNGDFMYDVFSNALILFDSKIGKNYASRYIFKGDDGIDREFYEAVVNGETLRYVCDVTYTTDANGKFSCKVYTRGQIKKEDGTYSSEESIEKLKSGQTLREFYDERRNFLLSLKNRTPLREHAHYKDGEEIYGEGYVLLKNVEPDNVTTRFKPKNFNQYSGDSERLTNNFSHNLIEVFNVPLSAITSNNKFDENFFTVQEEGEGEGHITLKTTLNGIDKINTTSSNIPLSLPNYIKFGNSTFTFSNTIMVTNPDYHFVIKKESGQNKYTIGFAEISTDVIHLGDSLETKSGLKTYKVNSSDAITTSGLNGYKSGSQEAPFGGNSKYAYVGNIGYLDGLAKISDTFDSEYLASVGSEVSKYENKNRRYNYLVNPKPICWMDNEFDIWSNRGYAYNSSVDISSTSFATRSGLNAVLEYVIKPNVFCNRKRVAMANLSAAIPSARKDIHAWDNGLQVLGNNSYINLSGPFDSASSQKLFFVPGASSETEGFSTSSSATRLFKKVDTIIADGVPLINTYSYNGGNNFSNTQFEIFNFSIQKTNNTFRCIAPNSDGSTIIENMKIVYSGSNLEVNLCSYKDQDLSIIESDDVVAYDLNLWLTNNSSRVRIKFEDAGFGNYSASLLSSSQLFIDAGTGSSTTKSKDVPAKLVYDEVIMDEDEEGNEIVSERNTRVINLAEKLNYEVSIRKYKISSAEATGVYEYGTIAGMTTHTFDGKNFSSGTVESNETIRSLVTVLDEETLDVSIDVEKMNSSINYFIIKYYTSSSTSDGGTPTYGYDLYQFTSNKGRAVSFVDYHTPTLIGSASSVVMTTATDTTSKGKVDESLMEDETVIIPTHAQAILLEITHITSSNDKIGVFSSSTFSNLKYDFSTNTITSADFSNKGIPQTGENALSQGNYLKRPTVNNVTMNLYDSANGIFVPNRPMLLEEVPNAPVSSIFAPNPKEKVLMLSSSTETKIVEVPLIYDGTLKANKFCLRLANIKGKFPVGGTSGSYIYGLNGFHIRVVGYVS